VNHCWELAIAYTIIGLEMDELIAKEWDGRRGTYKLVYLPCQTNEKTYERVFEKTLRNGRCTK
jgi:hypothetical protein